MVLMLMDTYFTDLNEGSEQFMKLKETIRITQYIELFNTILEFKKIGYVYTKINKKILFQIKI